MESNEEILHRLFGIRHDCKPTTPLDVKECKLAMSELRKNALQFVPLTKAVMDVIDKTENYTIKSIKIDGKYVSHILLPL